MFLSFSPFLSSFTTSAGLVFNLHLLNPSLSLFDNEYYKDFKAAVTLGEGCILFNAERIGLVACF
jgi:hypothetical protein